MGHRTAYTAGGQCIEGVAKRQHIGSSYGIKHLRTVCQGSIVDVLHTGKQGNIADIAVHSQCAGADTNHSLIAAGSHTYLTADHVCYRDRLVGIIHGIVLCCAGTQSKKHCEHKKHRQQLFKLHDNILLV